MVMEHIDGEDLLSYIPEGGMSEKLARGFFLQLCSAVRYCHTNNVSWISIFRAIFEYLFSSSQIIHGDIKLENILIQRNDLRLKLIDFGFAQFYEKGRPQKV